MIWAWLSLFFACVISLFAMGGYFFTHELRRVQLPTKPEPAELPKPVVADLIEDLAALEALHKEVCSAHYFEEVWKEKPATPAPLPQGIPYGKKSLPGRNPWTEGLVQVQKPMKSRPKTIYYSPTQLRDHVAEIMCGDYFSDDHSFDFSLPPITKD